MRFIPILVTALEVRLTDEEILADLLYPEAPRPVPRPEARP
jgi:hypothetical protein